MSRSTEKPPITCAVSVEAETEKAYLLLLLKRNPRFGNDWIGTATKSWFPKSQVTLDYTKQEDENIVVATIKEWIATKNGFSADVVDDPTKPAPHPVEVEASSYTRPATTKEDDNIPF